MSAIILFNFLILIVKIKHKPKEKLEVDKLIKKEILF